MTEMAIVAHAFGACIGLFIGHCGQYVRVLYGRATEGMLAKSLALVPALRLALDK